MIPRSYRRPGKGAPLPQVAEKATPGAWTGLGLAVEETQFPRADAARTAATAMLYAEAASVHERWLRDRADEYGADTRALLRQGQFLTATQYLRAQRVRGLIVDEVREVLRRYAALILPTIPVVAPVIGQPSLS